jgi:hypothetical protein
MQYSIETPPEVYMSGSVRATGTAYHAALELMYSWRAASSPATRPADDDVLTCLLAEATASFDSEFARAGEYWMWDDKLPNRDQAIGTITDMLRTYVNGGFEWPSTYQVYGVEVGFNFDWKDGHTRSGTMDLVLVDPFGAIIGVDHKTAGRMWPSGKEHPRKNNQASWYVGALKEMFPDASAYRFCFDVMTYAGKFDRRLVEPSDDHIKAIEDKATQVALIFSWARAAGLDLPANPGSNLCSDKYCDFWQMCPHGETLRT